jgi:hypothetical protein
MENQKNNMTATEETSWKIDGVDLGYTDGELTPDEDFIEKTKEMSDEERKQTGERLAKLAEILLADDEEEK